MRIDNKTAEAFLRRSGGTRSRILCDMAVAIRHKMLSRGQILSLQHVSSEDNIADMLSRFPNDHWEYTLKASVFHAILSFWQNVGRPDLDVFASKAHHLLPRYVSWEPDKQAVAQDAFTMTDWGRFAWVHPPTPLMTRVLHKLSQMMTLAIVVCPQWKHKSWWPMLQKMKLAELKLPPASQCLQTQAGTKVLAFVDPLHAYLVQGSPTTMKPCPPTRKN